MKDKRTRKHHIDSLLALLLFGVFAACILSVLLTGADAYRRLTNRDQESYLLRTCAQYITTKVRQAPSPQTVSVADFGGADALVLTEDYGGDTYLTRVYCYNGWLRELFASPDYEFYPEDGERILEAQDLSLSLSEGLLTVEVTDANGHQTTFNLSLRGGEGAAA